MNRFNNWKALLAFGLIACPVPLLGQLCVIVALLWRARFASSRQRPRQVNL
jgi:hypothetical protein